MTTPEPTPAGFFHGRVPVEKNPQLARDTYLLRLHAPALAAAIRPGQFVMARVPGRTDPLLPFGLAERLRELMVGAGLSVEFVAFGGGHGISDGVVDALGRFIGEVTA